MAGSDLMPRLPAIPSRRQLEMVNRLLLTELARRAPLLPGRYTLVFVDIDAM